MCTDPSEGQRTFCQCLSSSSPCMTQSPNTGCLSLLLAAFKTAFNQTELPHCCVELTLTPAPYASLSNRHCHPTSCSLTPLDLPCSACLSPLTLDLAASSALTLGHRHLHDHTSLLDGAAPFLAKHLAQSSTSSWPLFSLGQCRCLTPRSSTPPPPSPPYRRLDTVTSTFDTSSSF
jgi:hypothetical protein